MKLNSIIKLILRRPFFRGQDRLFNFFFQRGLLQSGNAIVKPLTGNFQLTCNPSTWIGAKIMYTGDYEPDLKRVFKAVIKPGDTILDVGANIGFHSLYFSELTGTSGKVFSFEPVPSNFKNLESNIKYNGFENIHAMNFALGNKNEAFTISADEHSNNPGSFNLFDKTGDILITCKIGDEVMKDEVVHFIKIDVEGYESFVIDGLLALIKKDKPTIVFEYDSNYHQKTALPSNYIFSLLEPLGYSFCRIQKQGCKVIHHLENIQPGNILASPHV